jgi:hypothetical protein
MTTTDTTATVANAPATFDNARAIAHTAASHLLDARDAVTAGDAYGDGVNAAIALRRALKACNEALAILEAEAAA